VFKNTFTRRGRRFTVDKWSVKIQHRGERRTFSLKAANKAAAAAEARQIYEKLLNEGGASAGNSETADQRGAHKLGAKYWKEALIVRSPPAGSSQGKWSAWLDHEGIGYYFPLQPDSANGAAVEAARIYRKIRARGWPAVFELHPREVTVAFHWTDNPLAWTYTTFATLPLRERAVEKESAVWRIVVVDGDRGFQRATEFYINLHPGFTCEATFDTVEGARRWMRISRPELVLVNQDFPDMEAAKVLAELKSASPDTLGMLFSVYADSGQLFKCSPGGALGYLFKRTPPERMLEPLLNAPVMRPPPPHYLSAVAVNYFEQVLGRLELKPASSKLARLTPRESQILDYLSKGFPDKEIAAATGISAWTVHGHLKSIFEKLQVHNRLEAVLEYLNK
jgi:DNA-binding NarL/FixJ family response regulator